MKLKLNSNNLELSFSKNLLEKVSKRLLTHSTAIVFLVSVAISIISFLYYSSQGHHLAYNDAMSHLDIARRVTDNLTPGLAQLGSVWLPLPHVLMLPTIWIDFFWRTGISAALISSIAYVVTVVYSYKTVDEITKNKLGALLAAFVVATNTNFLYLQTTALTEPLFIGLFMIAAYNFVVWTKTSQISSLIRSGLFIMLSTLTRYDGWATLFFASFTVFVVTLFKNKSYKRAEGTTLLFGTLAGLGVILWFAWNQLIFGDALYFAFGEFSAKSQQNILVESGDLYTQGDLPFSIITFFFSIITNIGILTFILGFLGWLYFMIKNKDISKRAIGFIFLSPFIFNVLALYLGHSVIHLPELIGDTWFNIRYGLLMIPWAAVFIGYLTSHRHIFAKTLVPIILVIQSLLFFSSRYVVTLDDGLWGSSQKNVKGTGKWIHDNIGPQDGLILVSVASHDAILFSSNLPLKRYIHEGTRSYWQNATKYPDQHARFVIMRTHDNLDKVSVAMDQVPNFFENYELIYDDEFADIYSLKANISTKPVNNTVLN